MNKKVKRGTHYSICISISEWENSCSFCKAHGICLSTKHYKQHMIQVYNNISSFINESINHLGLRQRMYSNLKAGIGKDCWESKIFKVYPIFTELFLIKSGFLKLLQHSFGVICMCCGLDYNSWLSLIIVSLHIPKP